MPEGSDAKEAIVIDADVLESISKSVASIDSHNQEQSKLLVDMKVQSEVHNERIITLFKKTDKNTEDIEENEKKIGEHIENHDKSKVKIFDKVVNALMLAGIFAVIAWFKDIKNVIMRLFS